MPSENQATIGLFGATGFVGSYLTRALLESGYRVVALVRPDSTFCRPFDKQNLLVVDQQSPEDLREAARWAPELRAYFHLAANVNVGEALNAPETFILENIAATKRSIELMRSYWASAPSILLSSDRVFGSRTGKLDEKSLPAAVDPYGLSKALSEDIVRFFAEFGRTRAIVIRTSNLYGPFQRSAQFIPSMLRRIWRGERTIQTGNLNTARNYLYIGDLIGGLLRLIEQIEETPATVHFGSSAVPLHRVTATLTDLAREFLHSDLQFVSASSLARAESAELAESEFACDVARDRLGWTPKVGITEGLRKTFLEEGRENGILRAADSTAHQP